MVKVAIFVPCYNCAPQLQRLIPQLASLNCDIYYIDNHSSDNTKNTIKSFITASSSQFLICHESNYGLGGSFKTALQVAKNKNYDWLVWFHGDDQAKVEDLKHFIELCFNTKVDAIFGARFHPKAKRFNYSLIRTLGNQALNAIASLILSRPVLELGSGLNAYRVRSLDDAAVESWPNHIAFDMNFLFYFIPKRDYQFEPIEWHETDQVSNARNFQVGFEVLTMLLVWFFKRRLITDSSSKQQRNYSIDSL